MIAPVDPQFIASVGFPIAACGFFMWRLEPLIKANNEVLAIVADYLHKKRK